MSAYLVAPATIDALVAGAKAYIAPPRGSGYWYTDDLHRCDFRLGVSDHEAVHGTYNPDTLGRMLWAENLRSINARYPDTIDNPEAIPGPIGVGPAEVMAYTYGPGPRVVDVDPFGLLGVVRGYVYQSCEHPGWRTSPARAFCDALKDAVIYDLIERTGANAWTIDDTAEVEGDLLVESGRHDERPGWVIRFVPGQSPAVSLSELIR